MQAMSAGRRCPIMPFAEGQPLRSLDILRNENAAPGQFFRLALHQRGANAGNAESRAEARHRCGSTPRVLSKPADRGLSSKARHVAIRIANGLSQDTTVHWHGVAHSTGPGRQPDGSARAGAVRLRIRSARRLRAGTSGITRIRIWCSRAGRSRARGAVRPDRRSGDDPPSTHPRDHAVHYRRAPRCQCGDFSRQRHRLDCWSPRRLLLVNGDRRPIHTVRPGATQRWRILNATASRHFRLALEDTADRGRTMAGRAPRSHPIGGATGLQSGHRAAAWRSVVTVNPTPTRRYRFAGFCNTRPTISDWEPTPTSTC